MILIAAVALALAAIAAAAIGWERHTKAQGPVVVVYKHPECNCCGKWVAHLQDNGFKVRVQATREWPQTRHKLGVADAFAACHTATVEGYLVEGHVPAQDIRRLLTERPLAKGLAVPGMPVGSPGMETGDQREPYDVLLMGLDDEGTVYAHHE